MSTLQQAIDYVQQGLDKGVTCPCCNQYCKLYKRALNSGMALWLIELVKKHEHAQDWVDVRTIDLRGGDYAKLVHWGLTENKSNDDLTKRTSGFWRPTQDGIDFAYKRLQVLSHVMLYNNIVVEFDGDYITIDEALGEKFDYSELM
jgi:hypothetical protein